MSDVSNPYLDSNSRESGEYSILESTDTILSNSYPYPPSENSVDATMLPVDQCDWLYRHESEWGGDDPSHEGYKDRLLICGSILVSQLRQDVFDELGFTCSGGVAHTKLLAKVNCPTHT